jgi:hypothetical protein
VTFIVQASGSQRSVLSQKAAISPCGSMTGVDRPRGAEAHRDHARVHVAGADRPHHIVAATRADRHFTFRKAPGFAQVFAKESKSAARTGQGRQRLQQVRVDEFDERFAPLFLADIEQAGA